MPTTYNTSGTVSDVLIGTGVLYVAAKGTAFPAQDSSTATQWAANPSGWTDVGFSDY